MALIPGQLPTGTKYPNDPQTLLETFAGYLTSPEVKKNRATVSFRTPSAGSTVTASPAGLDETVYLDNSATLATLTFAFPANANSYTGQILRIFARSAVTALTVTATGGLTIYGAALTTLAANGTASWQKVAANTWIRLN
jgi:hypothetical protein